jgi:hypothetical protein
MPYHVSVVHVTPRGITGDFQEFADYKSAETFMYAQRIHGDDLAKLIDLEFSPDDGDPSLIQSLNLETADYIASRQL